MRYENRAAWVGPKNMAAMTSNAILRSLSCHVLLCVERGPLSLTPHGVTSYLLCYLESRNLVLSEEVSL